jgi:peptide/nickel transport system substrate-binding protein
MRRRQVLAGGLALATSGAAANLAAPAIAAAAPARVLRFVPQGNLQNPDPIWTTTVIAKNHGYVIWDTLFGLDRDLQPKLQMLTGYEVSDDRLTWTLTLRDKLLFHDNQPVRAVDCVASISRWSKRDGFGQRLAGQIAEMRALDDKRIQIRLTTPFPLLPYALAYGVAFMMPERMARTDPYQQITEFVGSGPYRFVRDEWVSGSKAVYARFDGYTPRDEPPDFTSGGKVANFDRIEWIVMPDPATAAAALQTGEVDWIEQPLSDLLPMLRRAPHVVVEAVDPLGSLGTVRFNHLQPPFNNVKLRRALLPAVDQSAYMAAVMGNEKSLARTGVGIFTLGTPLANDAGLDILTKPRDMERTKRLVAESGYSGEPVVLLSPSDFPVVEAIAQVTRDLYTRAGLNVEYVSADWGTVVTRRNNREPVKQGGWSTFCTYGDGLSYSNPGSHTALWGNGEKGWYGWFKSDRVEALRSAWYEAPDLPTQQRIARQLQTIAFEEVPYIPVGQWFQPIARRDDLTGILRSNLPIFWNVSRKA